MLDFVNNELLRIESKFLEQSCGEGAFLQEIIKRKFKILLKKYKNCQNDFDKNLIILVSGIYGIDILEDNVKICRDNLYKLVKDLYLKHFIKFSKRLSKSILVIFKKNILLGDSLKMKNNLDEDLIFTEWTPIDNIYISRRDFYYENLINLDNSDCFIPREIKIYEPIKFFDIGDEYE